MRYFITGGAGFIGSHLAEYLLMNGNEVHVLDDFSTGLPSNLSVCEEDQFRLLFDCQIGSAMSTELVNEGVDWADIVIHLAAVVGVRRVLRDPIRTIEINLQTTKNVLDAASYQKKPVVIASSSEVYGKRESQDQRFKEDDNLVLGPTRVLRWSYAATKALDEWLGFSYCDQRDVPVLAVRFFNISGPRQLSEHGMVLPTFVKQALLKRSIRVFGDGLQARTFTHVHDAVKAVESLSFLLWGKGLPEVKRQAVNIGSEVPVTMMELAQLVKEITGSPSDIVKVPYAEAYGSRSSFEDMNFRCPDTSRLKSLLGWAPEIGIEDIIRDTVEFWKGVLKCR